MVDDLLEGMVVEDEALVPLFRLFDHLLVLLELLELGGVRDLHEVSVQAGDCLRFFLPVSVLT